jgi:bifunctional UDP-N-acetylglucosamine pyrophosphorylase / glucosamine-1-phosphate N-acetyltransferase
MPEPFSVLIMAAGQGTRMRSALPKVLHPICGKPMVEWVIDAARDAGAETVVCVTRPGDGVAEGLPDGVEVAEQREGEGTGSAVLAAREALPADRPVVVLSADHPLLSREEVEGLVAAHRRDGASATLLTTDSLDPAGYGRIVRDPDGSITRIVETKHREGLSQEELAIREVNLGTYVFEPGELMSALDGAQLEHGERYLTAVFPALAAKGQAVSTCRTDDATSARGVNDRAELMEVERLARRRLIDEHARAGVTFLAPETVVVEVGVTIGADTRIGPGVTLAGATAIGEGCEVGPHTTAMDARVGDRVSVAHSYLAECEVRDDASIGPFAYLRPGSVIGEGAKIGTFVEVKNSEIGAGAKVPHLSYIGDADIGEDSNVAAGNITANYDGRRKHRTQIGKSVKTGVHTSFVAPVSVGDGAYTGAGSVIVEDVPPGALGISRPEQENVEGYAERVEEDKEPSP